MRVERRQQATPVSTCRQELWWLTDSGHVVKILETLDELAAGLPIV
jgi:hypothetical protein